MNNIPMVLADHTPWHTIIELLTSPMFLVGGGIVVTLLVVRAVRNKNNGSK